MHTLFFLLLRLRVKYVSYARTSSGEYGYRADTLLTFLLTRQDLASTRFK